MIGETILHYKILEKLGEGGMGEVYKAQDTKLDRFVALKFLPSQLTASEDDKARFIQEAKAASSMNHPNICTIYSIEEFKNQLFIAMEFVEGKTLNDRKDSLSEKQKLEISVQVAEGLAAAHEKGIVHRDIKPENIMIRRDGIAQIMDFGLAKLYTDKNASRLTKVGTTMGTLGYMSPEQVQGLDVDHRTDLFSFGIVLYEMFAGESPFKGMHETAIMDEIVNVEAPPLSTIKPDIDPELDRIILECLEKEKDERCQSAKELAKDLRKIKKSTGQRKSRVYKVNSSIYTAKPGTSQPSNSSNYVAIEAFNKRFELKKLLPVLFILTFIIAASFVFLYLNKSNDQNSGIIQFEIQPPTGTKFAEDNLQVSPDGKAIVFTAKDTTGKTMIWIRPLESIKSNAVAGTENAGLPFWSYDGKYIGFFQDRKLQKINLSTGSKEVICDAYDGYGAVWNKKNQIIFMPDFISPLYKVNADGGQPVQLNVLNNAIGEEHQFPSQFFPDNIHYFYTSASRNQGQSNFIVGSLDGNSKFKFFGNNLSLSFNDKAFYIDPGYTIYLKDKTIFLQKFNTTNYKPEGESRTILNNIENFNVSGNTLVASEGDNFSITSLNLYNRKGKILRRNKDLGFLIELFPSPDENKIAYHRIPGPGDGKLANQDIWIYNRERDFSTRFTTSPAADIMPVWSPDGEKIVYSSSPDSVYDIYEKSLDGESKPKLLFKNNLFKTAADWSSDGKYILLGVYNPVTQLDLWVMPMFGDKKPYPYLQSKFNEMPGSISPDGNWVAYSSDETGRSEIYIQSFPEPGKKIAVSTRGGIYPKWRKDGKELFYISADDSLSVVEIKLNNQPEIGKTRALFKIDKLEYPNMYAVLNNGQDIMVNNSKYQTTIKSVRVIANWKSLLNEQ